MKKNYRSFEEAREFVRSLGLKGQKDWNKWRMSGNRPEDIPSNPNLAYKNFGWAGFGDFLGTGNIANQNRQYRPFEEARKYVRSLGLKGVEDWWGWRKSGSRPDDIPSAPNSTYKDSGWAGWGDFLGTGTIATQNRRYRPFEEAREFVRSLGLKGQEDWKKWCKSGNRPEDIPADPHKTYKDSGWKGFGNFLGTGNKASKDYQYCQFEEAREFARSLRLNGVKDWRKWSKSENRPEDIPADPGRTYKDSGWKGFGDFLGTNNKAPKDRQYRSFEEAREFVRSLGLKGQNDWSKWSKSGSRPKDIPTAPYSTYKDSGWKGFGDFLGTGTISSHNRQYRSFEEAREFARLLILNCQNDWRKWSKSGSRPEDIPATPDKIYKDSGWTNWGDFLGTGTIANKDYQYHPFEEAREFARSLELNGVKDWRKWSKSENRPVDIPSAPDRIYKDSGWEGWSDFLGTNNISTIGVHKARLKNTYATVTKVQSTFFLSYMDKFDNALLYQLFKLTNNPVLKKALKPIIESPNKAKVIEDIQAELRAEIDKNNEIDDSVEVTEENVDDITLDPALGSEDITSEDITSENTTSEDAASESDNTNDNPKDVNIILDIIGKKHDIIAECFGCNQFPAELEEWFWDNAVKEILLAA